MEQDYPEELGQTNESTLEERLSLRCDSLVKAGVAAALKDHLSQLDNQLSLAAANVDLSVFEAKVEIEKEFSSELQQARKEIVGLREQVKTLGEARVVGGPSIDPEVTIVPSGNEPGVHPLVALEGHLVRMSLAGGAAKDPAPEGETVKDDAPSKPATEAALTKSAKRRQRRKAKKPLQERRKATPRPVRPPRVDRPLSLGVREELRLATADLIRIRDEREQLRLELSALKAHCRATGVGEPRIPLPPVSSAGYGKMGFFSVFLDPVWQNHGGMSSLRSGATTMICPTGSHKPTNITSGVY
jgi:hypothetical protein